MLSPNRFCAALIAAAALAIPAARTPAQPAAGCDNLCAAAAALIERFELREAPTPVRERTGWAPPKRIVVADVEIADALRGIAPGVEVVGVPGLRNFAAHDRSRRRRGRLDRALHAGNHRARPRPEMDPAAQCGRG